MKYFLQVLSLCILFSLSNITTSATFFTQSVPQSLQEKEVTTSITIGASNKIEKNISIEEGINEIASYFDENIPSSYKYIKLYIRGAAVGTQYYESLQKLVYIGAIPNKSTSLIGSRSMSAYSFYRLAERAFNVHLIQSSQVKSFKERKANITDINSLRKAFVSSLKEEESQESGDLNLINNNNSKLLAEKQRIFLSVHDTLLTSHYNKKDITEVDLIEAATQGLAKGTGDKFTTYFPPTENKDFMESLDGKFEGIGSYVEMEEAGVLKIISPISGSPSEKAGLKGGDIVTHADEKEITKTTSLKEAVSWIKGPKGTTVTLTIKRGKQTLKIDVIRDTIVIKNVEHEKINSHTYYIKLITFGENISGEFTDALMNVRKNPGVKKIIIDLRNNPGGYLSEVSDMLSHFVPEGEGTVIVRYLKGNQNYYSKGYDLIDFSKYRIIILQNEGSASASEIMAGTIKGYLPETTILGMRSYGKGSVQTIKPYADGSSLKYTIAKWFTGKTQTGIDGVGIPTDVELEFDFEKFTETKVDNQLEKAKSMR